MRLNNRFEEQAHWPESHIPMMHRELVCVCSTLERRFYYTVYVVIRTRVNSFACRLAALLCTARVTHASKPQPHNNRC
jgi:hypothetical protein